MMEGPDLAKQRVVDYLKADMPSRLIAYRNYWNMDEYSLPNPSVYFPFAPPSVEYMTENFPCYTTIVSTLSVNRQDQTDGYDPSYMVTYDARTYIWVQIDGLAQVIKARDNLLTVIRTSILDHQCFETDKTKSPVTVRFDEGTIREEYSDAQKSKGDKWLAGGYVSYHLTNTEVVTRPTIGTVSEIRVQRYAFLEED